MEHRQISHGIRALVCVLSISSGAALMAQSGKQPAGNARAFDLSTYVRQAAAAAWECASAANDLKKAEESYELSKQERRSSFDIEAFRIDAVTKRLRLQEMNAAAAIDAMTAYFSLLQAERTRQAGILSVTIREEYAKNTMKKLKDGVAQEDDYLDQALLLRNAQLSLMNAEASRAKTRRQFLRMVDLDAASVVTLSLPDPAAFSAPAAQAKEYVYASLFEKAAAASSAYSGSKLRNEYARKRYEVATNPVDSVAAKERERLLWESQSAEHVYRFQSAAIEEAVTDLLVRRDSLSESLALAEQKKAVAEKKLASQKVRLSYDLVMQVDVTQSEASVLGEEAGLQKAKEDMLIHALRILAAAGTDILAFFPN
jgi:outer membrane protein TolC